jgi:DNA-binding PadR family transcriptional regulator
MHDCNDFGRKFAKMGKLHKLEKFAAMGGFGNWDDFPFGGGDFWGGHRRGPRGPGGPRKRMFGGGELRLVLLKLIADEPRHGYELMKALEEMTGGAYSPSPGTVYPTLSLLEDEGAIAESIGTGDEGPRKAFAATDAGHAELAERASEVEALMERLGQVGERQQRHRSPELGRAFANFGRVVANRFREGKFNNETLEEIVDIIDEAAKRIERL